MKFKLEIDLSILNPDADAMLGEQAVCFLLGSASHDIMKFRFAGHGVEHPVTGPALLGTLVTEDGVQTFGKWVVTKEEPDPAAIFAAALSVHKEGTLMHRDIYERFNGGDQFMRQCMAWATQFEGWACANLDFTHFPEVWPYFLEDGFGHHLLNVIDMDTDGIDTRQLTVLEMSEIFSRMCARFNTDGTRNWDGPAA